MSETKISGLIMLDFGRTVDRMKREDVERILDMAAAAKCEVVIATGGAYEEVVKCLADAELPEDKWPEISAKVPKERLATYRYFAKQYEIPIDHLILIDDADNNVACATTAGALALRFRPNYPPQPFTCQTYTGVRNENRNFDFFQFESKKEEFSSERPFFEALEETVAGLNVQRPAEEPELIDQNKADKI